MAGAATGSELHFYLDGTKEYRSAKDSGPLQQKNNAVVIGQAGVGSAAEYFKGMIDDVRIYKREMTQKEIAAQCNCQIVIPPPPPSPATASGGVEGYYSFEPATTAKRGVVEDQSGHRRHGKWEGNQAYAASKTAAMGMAARFDGSSRIVFKDYTGMKWGGRFGVTCWFKRTGSAGSYQGIINNGYYSHGSFEVRMGREGGGTMLGGGLSTVGHPKAWDHVSITAGFNAWHHVAMTYDGAKLDFYLDGKKEKHAASDTGAMKVVQNPLFIGHAGTGIAHEYFHGLIDEVRVYTKQISDVEIKQFCGAGCKITLPCVDKFKSVEYASGAKSMCALDITPTFADNVKYCTDLSAAQRTDAGIVAQLEAIRVSLG